MFRPTCGGSAPTWFYDSRIGAAIEQDLDDVEVTLLAASWSAVRGVCPPGLTRTSPFAPRCDSTEAASVWPRIQANAI
jgi:hypothetical protein